jgi:hypothetical protein
MDLLAVVPLRTGGWVRWAARVLGLIAVLLVLAWDVGGIVAIFTERTVDPLHVVQAVVMSLAATTMLVAWRWEKLGGLLGVLAGVAIGIVILLTAEPERKVYLLLVLALPLVIIGGTFLAADQGLPAFRRRVQA